MNDKCLHVAQVGVCSNIDRVYRCDIDIEIEIDIILAAIIVLEGTNRRFTRGL